MSDDQDDLDSDLAPRPRPGWRSRREAPVDVHALPQMVAAVMGGGLGVVALTAALLYLPPHMSTPILAGVSILMITRGAYGAWRVGVAEPRLKRPARAFTWLLAGAALVVFAATAVLGPGGLAPDWSAVVGRSPPPAGAPTVTFQPKP
jgi:hypothetical protein